MGIRRGIFPVIAKSIPEEREIDRLMNVGGFTSRNISK